MAASQYPKISQFKTPEAFSEYLQQHGIELPMKAGTEAQSRPISVFGRQLPNRWAALPMEGWDCGLDGVPSELTLRRWYRVAQGGASLLAGVEAAAVMNEGRSSPRQLLVSEQSLPTLEKACREMRRLHHERFGSDPCIGLQLTHSGRYSHPNRADLLESRTAWTHPLLDRKFGSGPSNVVTDGEISGIIEAFALAAKRAQEAGFDFVDIKHAHGYLLHEFLGAYGRPGPYGGSFENRTRLSREVLSAVRREAPGLGLAYRLSIFDIIPFMKGEDGQGHPMVDAGGYHRAFGSDESGLMMDPNLTEPVRFVKMMQEFGCHLVIGTVGSPYYTVHLQRPAWYAVADGYPPPEDPLYNVGRHIAAARRLKELCPEIQLVSSGVTALQEYLPMVAEAILANGWCDYVGLGRMMLSYPDFPADVLAGRPLAARCVCRTFGDCTNGPRKGVVSGCYRLDEFYRKMPEAAIVLKKTPTSP